MAKNEAEKAEKLAESVAKKSRHSTAHLPKYEPLSWSHYSPKSTDPRELTREELARIVNKAAKAANQRIRSLERSGLSSLPGAYKYAQGQTGKEKPRFKERSKPTEDLVTLRQRYFQLREFMTMKTSTPTGVRAVQDVHFNTAKERGFRGTKEQWNLNVEKYFAKVRDGLMSSDIVYKALVQNNEDVLDDMLNQWREDKDEPTAGEQLLAYLRRKRAKERG